MSNTAIQVKGLSHDYGDQQILKNISFQVRKGTFFIIIGPNGSGKTTLMRLISGTLTCPGERLEILERPMEHHSRKELAKCVAFVPQKIPSEFPFTVMELVLMGRAPHLGLLGLENQKDMDIATQAMTFTGVDHLARRRLDQLSGGEQQRVFISRAIAQEPRIILLDEPTASLDIAHQIRVMDLMEKLKEEKGVTVVMVSHDVNFAAMYGDALLLLRQGEIVRLGPPDQVLDPRVLEEVYGCHLLVDKGPFGKLPRVTPVPHKFMNKP